MLRGGLPKLLLALALGIIGWKTALGVVCPAPERAASTGSAARHLLLISLDTTRADRIGSYGYDRPTTPNLDALASESAQFDLAIAQAAVTPVSHASILTGRDPHHHGLRVLHGLLQNHLEDEQRTLAEVWREAGGQTAAFLSAFPVSRAFGLDQGFDHFEDRFPRSGGRQLVTKHGVVNTGSSQRRADTTTNLALSWLDTGAESDRSIFMWVHYFDPHDPLILPPKPYLLRFPPASRERPDVLRATYDAELAFLDAQLGRLLRAWKEKGLWGDTIVVVVADHGEGLGDHDWWSHGILYQEQIRVPLLIRVPGMVGGVRVPSLVRTTDIMPTALDAGGIDRAQWPEMDGRTLLRAMRHGETADARIAYADSVNMLSYGRRDQPGRHDEKHDKLYSLFDGRYKLIHHQLHPEASEFYDLREDPRETKNLATGGARPPRMQALQQRLEEMNAFSGLLPGMTPTDAERLEQLKSLGYAE